MKKILSVMLCLLISMTMMMAQNKTITGKVLSGEDGEPIIGATVIVTGTSLGTVTDLDGMFSVKVPNDAKTLTVSYVGMESKVVKISGSRLVVELISDDKVLDDVVVVAYGSQKKTSLTGAIQSVNEESLKVRPTSSVTSALEGTVAGVQINNTYGAPGEDPTIRIRGISSVNGNSTPLYILDGVAFGGNISDLNPADIESISVLKDAASAALYGNRASAGVILITTKQGKQGKLSVSLDVKQGTYSRGIPEYKLTNARQWMEAEFQNLKNYRMYNNGEDAATAGAYAKANLINDIAYLNIFNKADDQLFDDNGKLVSDAQILSGYQDDLDWFDQGIRSGYRQDYNVAAVGSTDKATYRFSLGYLDENGYVKNSGFERFTASTAVSVQPRKWIKFGVSMNASHQNKQNTNGDSSSSYTNVFMYARQIAPIYPVHLHDVTTGNYILDEKGNKQYDSGSYEDANGNLINTRNQYQDRHVYYENELNFDKTIRNTVNTTATADLILPYGFKFTVKGNLNLRNDRNETYNSAVIGDGKGSLGRAKREEYSYKNYQFMQQLYWSQTYGRHTVDALIGHENFSNNYNYLYSYKTNEIVAGWGNLTNFTVMTSLDGSDYDYTTESYLGRVHYDFDSRYNVEVSFRRDGSSRFAKESRWGNFWSVGGNWNISAEEFMKPVTWVNYLKLRADYGEVGNDASAGYYASKALYSVDQNANLGAIYLSNFPNSALQWETSQSWGVALESRLFNRLNFNIEYFDKRNKDLIFDVYLPLSSGATSSTAAESVVTQNLGTMSNRGVEITADVDVFKNRDWKVNIGTNATFLKNEIVELPEQNKDGIIDGTKFIKEGHSRYDFYMYTWEGIDSYNGYSLYKFNDGDEQGYSYCFEKDGVKYGDWASDEAVQLTDAQVADNIVIIDGKPYSTTTTYAKKEYQGTSIPKLFGSFNLNVSYKHFTFGALFTYSLGAKTYDGVYAGLMSVTGTPSNFHEDIAKAWTTADATDDHAIWSGKVPVVNYGLNTNLNASSSRFLTSSDYLVFKNVNLSYDLPKSICEKLDVAGILFNASCENVFTKTARQGMNPQQSYAGTQSNYLVTPRVFTVGVNVKF